MLAFGIFKHILNLKDHIFKYLVILFLLRIIFSDFLRSYNIPTVFKMRTTTFLLLNVKETIFGKIYELLQ